MADYQKMYTALFNAVTDAIKLLQSSQQHTEEMYISADEPIIKILPSDGGNRNDDGGCQE